MLNEDLLSVILANSRNPVEVRGDLLSLVSANDTGARRLIDMMAEFELCDRSTPLAEHILDRIGKRRPARPSRALPERRHGPTKCRSTAMSGRSCIKAEAHHRSWNRSTIDFTGSSPASIFGINSPRTYTHAYSVFGLKAVIAPHVPNNAGSLSCFDLVTEPAPASIRSGPAR